MCTPPHSPPRKKGGMTRRRSDFLEREGICVEEYGPERLLGRDKAASDRRGIVSYKHRDRPEEGGDNHIGNIFCPPRFFEFYVFGYGGRLW